MSNLPLQEALDKIDAGDVAVDAPEWSSQGGWTLAARTATALLLFALVATVLWNVTDELPGETRQSEVFDAFENRATHASKTVATALEARQTAGQKLRASRAAVVAAQEDTTTPPADLREARRQRAADRQQLGEKRRSYQQKVAERSAALSDVLAMRPTSDVDLVRAVGVGAVALLALLGAGALLAPRRSQLLSVRRLFPTPAVAPPAAGAAALAAAGAGAPAPSAAGPTVTPGGLGSSSGVARTEPALTQGVLAAVALAAGLFGIQELEGTAEVLLNLALPLVPIVGALFTRARVAPRPNLSPEERLRLFGG